MPPVGTYRDAYLDPDVVEHVKSLELFVRGAVEGGHIGAHRSTLYGLSTEFTHHRPYSAGDELKHIDWKVYSKTDRYHVKKFEAETNFDAHFLFDASSSMQYGSTGLSKMEYSKRLAAVLAHLVVKQGDSAGVAVFDDELRESVRPGGSMGVIGDICALLHGIEGRPRTNVGAILDEYASRLRRRGFVMLFSDLFDNEDGFIDGMNHLSFKGQHIIIFHVMDPEEMRFPFDGTVRFQGLEGESELKVQPDRIRADYLEELQALQDRIRNACTAIRADYVVVDTSRAVPDVLIEYLNARKAMRWRG